MALLLRRPTACQIFRRRTSPSPPASLPFVIVQCQTIKCSCHLLHLSPEWCQIIKDLRTTRQACYVGTLGARGIQNLQSYNAPKPEYDNKAYTLTSTYHGGTLKMYASYPIQPSTPGGAPGYAMTQLKAYALTNDLETFCHGATACRNGRDWAKRKRDEFIERANSLVTICAEFGLSPTATSIIQHTYARGKRQSGGSRLGSSRWRGNLNAL